MSNSLRIFAEGLPLLNELAKELEPDYKVSCYELRPGRYVLRYRAGLDPMEILARIAPMNPPTEPVTSLEFDYELHIGDSESAEVCRMNITSRDEHTAEKLKDLPAFIGLQLDSDALNFKYDSDGPESTMLFGGAPRFVRDLLKWRLARLGFAVPREMEVWSKRDRDIWLTVIDGASQALPPRARVPIELVVDEPDYANRFVRTLESAGFRVNVVKNENLHRFSINVGCLTQDSEGFHDADLRRLTREFLTELGVDLKLHPIATGEKGLIPKLELPLKRFERRTLRPRGGDLPGRFRVRLFTDKDHKDALEPLANKLRAAGFARVKVGTKELGPAPISSFHNLRECPATFAKLVRIFQETPLEGLSSLSLEAKDSEFEREHDGDDIDIYLPPRPVGASTAPADTTASKTLYLMTSDGKAPPGLEEALACLVTSIKVIGRPVGRSRIRCGAKHESTAECIKRVVQTVTGQDLVIDPNSHETGDDLWVEWVAPELLESDDNTTWDEWRDPSPESCPFIERLEDAVRIGSVILPKVTDANSELIPVESAFDYFCLDQATALTVAHVASCAKIGEPCLLEGPTSTSKTSSILYVASLIGQPVARMNLSGQTDTSELVGRYMPTANGWQFHEGIVIRAMREGLWLVLDELNLAEPQVLERLNSLLETPPTLVLTEHDNRAFGGRATPIHPRFRLFATMNPAEYAGRSSLSPAWRDRWLGHAQVRSPTEKDHLDLLMFLIAGSAPNVTVDGQVYFGERRSPPLPGLGALFLRKPDVGEFANLLARFHAGIESAASGDSRSLGGGRKDTYVFTRRSLLAVMHSLERHIQSSGPSRMTGALAFALKRYYLDRLGTGRDRDVANNLLEAVGLVPETFAPRSTTESTSDEKPLMKPLKKPASLAVPKLFLSPTPWGRRGGSLRLPGRLGRSLGSDSDFEDLFSSSDEAVDL